MPPFIPRKRRRSPTPMQPSLNSTETTPTRKPTLFDTLDAKPRILTTVQDNKEFLDNLNGHSDSSLSDISSSDFEDVIADAVPPKRRKVEDDEAEEEEMEWEDAMVPDVSFSETPVTVTSKDLEITLGKEAETGSFTDPHCKKKGPSKRDREIRIATHCMHVQFLMYHNAVRNAWICDDEVQKILVTQLPQGVKKAVDKWKLASGIPMVKSQEEEPKIPARVKGTKAGNRKSTKPVHQRDWGKNAERQEEGTPNMSRGDPLIRLLKILAAYWRKRFTITAPGLRKQGYKPLAVLASEIASFRNDSHNAEEHGERINDIAEFRKLAKKCEGSRDVGAQLFTALVRELGLEARMVASLQPAGFGWSKNEEAALKRKRGGQNAAGKVSGISEPTNQKNSMETEDSIAESDISTDDYAAVVKKNSQVELSAGTRVVDRRKGTGKGKGLRGNPIDLSESSDSATDKDDDLSVVEVSPQLARKCPGSRFDRDLPFPIYWTEVASPITKRIIPVDPLVLNPPVATNDVLLSSFEPRGAKADKAKQVIAYVLAFSSDGTAKDVTTRYLKRHMWPGKTKGMRLPVEKVPVHTKRGRIKGYEEYDWFKTVMSGYKRTDKMRTAVDDVEDMTDLKPVKPEKKVAAEGEETLQGYKNSAEFVLERHLRREEALLPEAQHVRLFKSGKTEKAKEEKVFRREDVVVCRTGESWHKEGRQVKPGEYPMKMVPVRAVTLIRKREVEEAERDTGEKLKQGLYAWDQTEWIIPPPIENGIIPKNAFGNIDCYVPTMVPKGAVHIRHKGTVKVCKRLGIDFAEAVTGFEFGKQRAVPVITGVVVAQEYEKMVRDAWEMDEEERRKKEEGKREKVALAMWRRFLMGLRIVERVRDEYGGDASAHVKEEMNPFTNRNKRKQQVSNIGSDSRYAKHEQDLDNEDHDMAGGFIPEDHMDAVDEGGLVLESDEPGGMDADPKSVPKGLAVRANESMADVSNKTPRSLQSAHRDASRVSPQSAASDEALNEEISPLVRPLAKNKSPKRVSMASKLRQKADMKNILVGGTAKSLTKGREQKARLTKLDTDESSDSTSTSDLTSLEDTGGSEPSKSATARRRTSRANRRVVNEDRSLLQVSQETPPDSTNRHSNRVMLKRTAARKSDTAVKSHYFEHGGTENEDDSDNETLNGGPISGSKKRKTTSTSRIRKAQDRKPRRTHLNLGITCHKLQTPPPVPGDLPQWKQPVKSPYWVNEEVIYTNPQARGSNGASASRPAEARPQQNPQPVHRMPLVIRRLPSPPPNLNIPEDAEDFTFKFLLSNFRGTFQPPGCYHVTKQTQLQVYPVKAWYAIDSDEEPFMPARPGQHGAKLTLVMPEESDADEYDPKEAFPFFVKRGSRGYVYYGTYMQPRYSDRLSYAEMELEVPSSVKVHRAKEVGRKDKPKWMVEAVKWERVVATDKEAQAFGPVDILKAFQRADTDLGLRLYWDFFECMGYDRNLYDALVARKRSSE